MIAIMPDRAPLIYSGRLGTVDPIIRVTECSYPAPVLTGTEPRFTGFYPQRTLFKIYNSNINDVTNSGAAHMPVFIRESTMHNAIGAAMIMTKLLAKWFTGVIPDVFQRYLFQDSRPVTLDHGKIGIVRGFCLIFRENDTKRAPFHLIEGFSGMSTVGDLVIG